MKLHALLGSVPLVCSSLAAAFHSANTPTLPLHVGSPIVCTTENRERGECELLFKYGACIELQNPAPHSVICTFETTALFSEGETGHTKEVSESRRVRMYPQQKVRLCLNFDKDKVEAWEFEDFTSVAISCIAFAPLF
jgi:hypothetical protein